MEPLVALFRDNEDWLMQRVLSYAKASNYTKYTSTLEEAWRLSISGLTASLCEGITSYNTIPVLGPDDDVSSDPVSEFGVLEAQRHRKRGVTLGMFLGLMKYYRQSYIDLMAEKGVNTGTVERLFVDRCFDRFEVAFCQEWAAVGTGENVKELQIANRFMTNEKNTYLTAFESLSDPVVMLDREEKLLNLNHAAMQLIDPAHVPGGHYYHAEARKDGALPYGKRTSDTGCIGSVVTVVFPWLAAALESLRTEQRDHGECEATVNNETRYFEIKRSDMLDVSEKFTATIIILRDITLRKTALNNLKATVAQLTEALSEVKKLSGLLPICASCKKVRDDKGYWSQVEEYVSERSDATFSHGICPDCIQKLYPQIATAILSRQKQQSGNGLDTRPA